MRIGMVLFINFAKLIIHLTSTCHFHDNLTHLTAQCGSS